MNSQVGEREGSGGAVARLAESLSEFSQRWMPNSLIFAMVATLVVAALALILDGEVRSSPVQLAAAWGDGFWVLLTFSMQASLTIVAGGALATTPPVRKLVQFIGRSIKSEPKAVMTVALCSCIAGYVNWPFGLIFAAILSKEFARNIPRVDYRAMGACAFICMGSMWALGLSSSAALFMATPGTMPAEVEEMVGGVIPLEDTLFTWQAILVVIVEIVVVAIVAYKFTPPPEKAVTASDLGVDLEDKYLRSNKRQRPGDFLEYSPLLTIVFTVAALIYVSHQFIGKGFAALDFNMVNFIFIVTALALHWRPVHFINAMREATPAIWGIVLQFPFYAGIFGLIVNTSVSHDLGVFFVSISNDYLYPVVVAIYSFLLGIAVPSGGSKWVIEAPYLIEAAQHYNMNIAWLTDIYNISEAMANLVQPFWMLPILGILGLKARHIMGFTFAFGIFLFPVVLLAAFLLNFTF